MYCKKTMDWLINATGNWVKFYTVKKLSLIQTSRNENKIINKKENKYINEPRPCGSHSLILDTEF